MIFGWKNSPQWRLYYEKCAAQRRANLYALAQMRMMATQIEVENQLRSERDKVDADVRSPLPTK